MWPGGSQAPGMKVYLLGGEAPHICFHKFDMATASYYSLPYYIIRPFRRKGVVLIVLCAMSLCANEIRCNVA